MRIGIYTLYKSQVVSSSLSCLWQMGRLHGKTCWNNMYKWNIHYTVENIHVWWSWIPKWKPIWLLTWNVINVNDLLASKTIPRGFTHWKWPTLLKNEFKQNDIDITVAILFSQHNMKTWLTAFYETIPMFVYIRTHSWTI